MKPLFQTISLLVAAMALTSCPDPKGGVAGSDGPFDENGTYVEAWADNPPNRKHTSKNLDALAANDAPPPNITPLDSGSPDILLPPTTPAKTSSTSPKSSSRATAGTSSRPKTSSTGSTSGSRSSTAKTSSSRPKTSVAKNSKSSSSKSKTSSSPKTVRHTVKKGDTLGGLATKYGTSVSAIQKANGIKGTLIYDGKSLVIPSRKK